MAGTTPNLGLYLPGGGSTGVWLPDEVADIDPLNQNFIDIDTAVGALQDYNDWTGPVDTNIATAATGWSITSTQGRKRGGLAFIQVVAQRTGSAVTVPSDGNIGNVIVAAMGAGWIPAVAGTLNYPAVSGGSVSLEAGYLGSDGGLRLTAVAPGTVLNTGASVDLVAAYPYEL